MIDFITSLDNAQTAFIVVFGFILLPFFLYAMACLFCAALEDG